MKNYVSLLARVVLLLFLIFSGAMSADEPSAAQGPQRKLGGIHVRLSVPKKAFRLGEAIPLRVEIYNAAGKTVIINREISRLLAAPACLALSVFDERGRRSPALENVASAVSPPAEEEPEAWTFLKWWVVLDTEHFYGLTFEVDGEQFPFLTKPGRYRLVGTFTSIGGYPPSIVRRMSDSSQVPSKVPYPIWTGKVDTNSVWLEVVRR